MSRKAPEAEKPENHERWIVSYADMVTLLFALFVVLYATSDANPHKLKVVRTSLDRAFDVGVLSGTDGASPIFDSGGGLTPSITEIKGNDFAAIQKELAEFGKANGLTGKINIRQEADSITISLQDNLLFDSGSAELRPGSQLVLDEVAAIVGKLPNRIRVEGHTDNVPVNSAEYETNWELSTARATRVLRFLESKAVDGDRMEAAGYEDNRPVATNDNAAGRAQNRRADIVILYPTQEELEAALAASAEDR